MGLTVKLSVVVACSWSNSLESATNRIIPLGFSHYLCDGKEQSVENVDSDKENDNFQ